MSEIIIPIEEIKIDFQNVLQTENNSRIFFSGKFGIGKTYFLKEFFESKKDKYETFHLFPVNYQISMNEDILELIKYDLLVELVKKDENILKNNEIDGIKDSTLLFYSWCKNRFTINSILKNTLNINNFISEITLDPIIGFLGKLGRPLQDLLKIDEEYQDFKKEYKDGEKGQVEKYMKVIKEKNISEVDYISFLIKEKIKNIKGDKKSILVIDDLDRIDPEHIFRMLNIFSAYFENEHENKFGFDQIVVVADYSNLMSIFHHKYGPHADFDGYIDKFFSITPYYFDNKKAILDLVDEIAKSIKNEESTLAGAIGDSGYIKLFLRYIFAKNIEAGTINLRQLLKSTKYQLLEFKKGSYQEDSFSNNFLKIFDKAVKVAIHSFSNTEIFIKKLESIKNIKVPEHIQAMIPFDTYVNAMLLSFGVKVPEENNRTIKWLGYTIKKDTTKRNGLSVEGGNLEDLFIDILIEYIKNKKYQKNSYRDYEY